MTNNDLQFVVPSEMRALVLDGTGFDHLQIRKIPTPRPGEIKSVQTWTAADEQNYLSTQG